jgi:hypothetical protein
MSDQLELLLRERFAAQDDQAALPDLGDVRRRASRSRCRTARRPSKRLLLAAAALSLLAASGGIAVGVGAFDTLPVTHGFSALDDPNLAPAPSTPVPNLPVPLPNTSVMDMFRELGPGEYQTRTVGAGMYLARRGDALCEVVIRGAGGCTDSPTSIQKDVWLLGDERRQYDSETAPFEVHIYGFARDDVTTVTVSTGHGQTIEIPASHNAFQATLKDTSFAQITAIVIGYTNGSTATLDPHVYFPQLPPAPRSAKGFGRSALRASAVRSV